MLKKLFVLILVFWLFAGFVATSSYALNPVDVEEDASETQLQKIDQAIQQEIEKQKQEKEAIIQERNAQKRLEAEKRRKVKRPTGGRELLEKRERREFIDRRMALFGKLFALMAIIIIGVVYLTKYLPKKKT